MCKTSIIDRKTENLWFPSTCLHAIGVNVSSSVFLFRIVFVVYRDDRNPKHTQTPEHQRDQPKGRSRWPHSPSYVNIRQSTSSHVIIRQYTSVYVSTPFRYQHQPNLVPTTIPIRWKTGAVQLSTTVKPATHGVSHTLGNCNRSCKGENRKLRGCCVEVNHCRFISPVSGHLFVACHDCPIVTMTWSDSHCHLPPPLSNLDSHCRLPPLSNLDAPSPLPHGFYCWGICATRQGTSESQNKTPTVLNDVIWITVSHTYFNVLWEDIGDVQDKC
jgi:hypothetical protein